MPLAARTVPPRARWPCPPFFPGPHWGRSMGVTALTCRPSQRTTANDLQVFTHALRSKSSRADRRIIRPLASPPPPK